MLTFWMYLMVLLIVRTALQAGECVSVERISTDSTLLQESRGKQPAWVVFDEKTDQHFDERISQFKQNEPQEGAQRLHIYIYEESIQTVQVRCLPAQDTRCANGRKESCSC